MSYCVRTIFAISTSDALVEIFLIWLVGFIIVNYAELDLHRRNSHLRLQLLDRVIFPQSLSMHPKVKLSLTWLQIWLSILLFQWWIYLTIWFVVLGTSGIFAGWIMLSKDFRSLRGIVSHCFGRLMFYWGNSAGGFGCLLCFLSLHLYLFFLKLLLFFYLLKFL